jgi:glucose/mannose transport system substrate-binding protein
MSRRTYLRSTAAGVAGLAALAGSGAAQGQPVEILHGWTGGDGKAAVESLAEGFQSEHPDVPSDFRPIGGGGNENLNAVVAKRLANRNPPGAFANWPGKNLVKYEGALGDIEQSVWEQAGLKDAHVEEAVEACRFQDGMSAVPIGSHRLNCLFYNVGVVEDAGVDPSSLESPSDLIDAMDQVSQNTDAVPMAQAMKGAWTPLQLWAVVLLGQEGFQPYMNFVNGEGSEGPVRRAFETTKEILTNYINDDAASIGFTTANQKIMNGEAAFIHQGNWVAGAYKNNDLTYDEDWGFEPFPGTQGMYTLHMDAFLYPSRNPTPEGAQTFLRYAGSKDAHVRFNSLKGSIPTRTDVATEEFGPYLSETMTDFAEADQKPPTLAHGLAVEPETLTALKDVITNNFTGPYDVDAATQAMLETVSG